MVSPPRATHEPAMTWYLLFGVLSVAAAGVVHDGNCPTLKPVENFNLTAYLGKWYEISKYPNEMEKDGKCSYAEYSADGEAVKVKNTNVVNGVQISIDGSAKPQPDANGSAKLIVTLKTGDVSRDANLMVLTTDYNSYAIAYNCRFNATSNSHLDFVWVLGREKVLEGAAKTAVDDFFTKTKELDSSKLLQTDFSEEACKFNSTLSLSN